MIDERMDPIENAGPIEIAVIGDLTDHESEVTEKLLSVEPGGECTLYIDSPGGSPYTALSLMSIMKLRGLQVTGIVTGECSSAMLWPFAACQQRFVTPYSVLLFHPMKWQSEEHVGLAEAAEWARHFGHLEDEMDELLAQLFDAPRDVMDAWITPGRYVTGRQLVEQGLAQMLPLEPLPCFQLNGAASHGRKASSKSKSKQTVR
ncbi:MAG: ATP-dependent Clp protease proteolytic subunit [Planctomycetales bacterium]|nr:ATP-dependent Clp protease proteolytic subunit [Planctomycetales bacterium]